MVFECLSYFLNEINHHYFSLFCVVRMMIEKKSMLCFFLR
jgi:hypothetical protein